MIFENARVDNGSNLAKVGLGTLTEADFRPHLCRVGEETMKKAANRQLT
jgi:hypothetical protein